MGRGDRVVAFVCCTANDVADYLDVDMLELYEDDFKTIDYIWKLSDTTKDKLTFTVSTTINGFTHASCTLMFTLCTLVYMYYKHYIAQNK